MTDRRRINGPPSGTYPLSFASRSQDRGGDSRPQRTRQLKQHRKIFLRTGLTPSASGSAYLELQPTPTPKAAYSTLILNTSSLKLSCTVRGPKPLPRSAAFSPQLILSTHVKFTPYASRSNRKGFVRDSSERDLSVHLETALRGVIIGDRWPKSGVDVTITVLEAEDEGSAGLNGLSMMNVLAGCITVASAALIEAGIDCVDTIVGGVAALAGPTAKSTSNSNGKQPMVDPCASEHIDILAACMVGYLPFRDEITEMWMTGDAGEDAEALIDRAVEAAVAQKSVLTAVLKESLEAQTSLINLAEQSQSGATQKQAKRAATKIPASGKDIEMTT